jgi:hypothetical protein
MPPSLPRLMLIYVAFFLLVNFPVNLYADDLIEVTAKTQVRCVEYFNRNGKLFCSTTAIETMPVPADIVNSEKQNIVFDHRTWKVAWGKKNEHITTIEYIPAGDDIDNWKELITTQYFPQLPKNITPVTLATAMVSDLKEKGYKPVITFHKKDPENVIFEFQIGDPPSQAQDEIQMIRRGKNGLYILHYVTRNSDMGKEERTKWLQNFSQSTIK